MRKCNACFWLILLVFAVAATVFVTRNFCRHEVDNHFYPQTMRVYQVDRINDNVTLIDRNGELWQFKGCEDWAVNDGCSLIMYDNGTPYIKDDVIVRVRYNGFGH